MPGRPPGAEARSGRVKEGMHTHPAELHTGNTSENSADFMETCESSAHKRGKQEDTRRYLCCECNIATRAVCRPSWWGICS